MFSVHTKTQNSSALKSVPEKLCFRDGLVWTVGLSVEIKLDFEISPELCEKGLSLLNNHFSQKKWTHD